MIVFSEKKRRFLFYFVHVVLLRAYIIRDNAKKITSVGISYMGLILFSKIFHVFDVVYVK